MLSQSGPWFWQNRLSQFKILTFFGFLSPLSYYKVLRLVPIFSAFKLNEMWTFPFNTYQYSHLAFFPWLFTFRFPCYFFWRVNWDCQQMPNSTILIVFILPIFLKYLIHFPKVILTPLVCHSRFSPLVKVLTIIPCLCLCDLFFLTAVIYFSLLVGSWWFKPQITSVFLDNSCYLFLQVWFSAKHPLTEVSLQV